MSKFAKCVCLINSLLKGNQSYFLHRVYCIFHEVNFSNFALSCVCYCSILRSIFSCCSGCSAVCGLVHMVPGCNKQKPLFCRSQGLYVLLEPGENLRVCFFPQRKDVSVTQKFGVEDGQRGVTA